MLLHGRADYNSPKAFAANLLKCMQNDWHLTADALFAAVVPCLKAVSSSTLGVSVSLEPLLTALQKEPAPLQSIMDVYLKLSKDAKQNRKDDDPWPVIIIDEANALMEWDDKQALHALLKLFVYLTKQEQLAHVVLATNDIFLVQWLDSGMQM